MGNLGTVISLCLYLGAFSQACALALVGFDQRRDGPYWKWGACVLFLGPVGWLLYLTKGRQGN